MKLTRRQFTGMAAAAGIGGGLVSSSAFAQAAPRGETGRIFPAMPPRRGPQVLLDLSDASFDELAMFVSLQGQVNRDLPSLWVGYPSAPEQVKHEGVRTWADSVGANPVLLSDPYQAIARFRSAVRGLTIYDPAVPATLNLATTLASRSRTLTVSADLASRLRSADPTLEVVDDLRGRFRSTVDTVQWAYDHLWPDSPHDFIVGLDPRRPVGSGDPGLSGFIRDYAIATGALVVFLDPSQPEEKTLFAKFLNDMPSGRSAYVGWYAAEFDGVGFTSGFGVETIALDRVENLTLFAHGPEVVRKPAPAAPRRAENKIYLGVALSDGDNIQYVQHYMRYVWDRHRGSSPLTWTISPSMLELAPEMYSYFARTKAPADALMAGPSGIAYMYPEKWPPEALDEYLARTQAALARCGLTVSSVWNAADDGFYEKAFAKMPSLRAITTQNLFNGAVSVQNSGGVMIDFLPDYTQQVDDVKQVLEQRGAEFGGKAPVFVACQFDGWVLDFDGLRDLENSLDDRYEVVNLEQMTTLARRAATPVRVRPGNYTLTTFADGQVVGVQDGSAVEGAGIVQQRPTGGAFQSWAVAPVGAGYYRLTNVHSSLALAVRPQSGSGAGLIQALQGRSGSDQWRFVRRHTGNVSLVNRLSGLCADINGASTAENTALIQYRDVAGPNQAFSIVRQ